MCSAEFDFQSSVTDDRRLRASSKLCGAPVSSMQRLASTSVCPQQPCREGNMWHPGASHFNSRQQAPLVPGHISHPLHPIVRLPVHAYRPHMVAAEPAQHDLSAAAPASRDANAAARPDASSANAQAPGASSNGHTPAQQTSSGQQLNSDSKAQTESQHDKEEWGSAKPVDPEEDGYGPRVRCSQIT